MRCFVGQTWRTGNVSDGIDAGDIGLQMLIHFNK